MTVGSGPVDNLSVGGDVELPFACRREDGTGNPDVVLKPRAIQCALSRICGVCGHPLSRPLAFVGGEVELAAEVFAFPPAHVDCAKDVLAAGRGAAVVTTAGFDLIRPARRGEAVSFRANSVIRDGDPGR